MTPWNKNNGSAPPQESGDVPTGGSEVTAKACQSRVLPFSKWWPLLAGALSGIVLRLVFSGDPGEAYAAMMGTYIYLSPILVGAVTVYIAEKKVRRRWGYYLLAPFVANVIYVLGTLLIMIEGLVCAVVIAPLFGILGSLGGLVMGMVCRAAKWPKQTLYSLSVLPLILGFFETNLPLPEQVAAVERSILINAKPVDIWLQIHNASDIKAEEVRGAWLYRIGVPVPLTGVTHQTPRGLVRRVTMGKGIHFDQVLTDWSENQYVRWTYHFDKDSFPPQALDEHVVLGGHYFDLKDTSYRLVERDGFTELTVRMHYRVSTQFNWYADPVAKFLLGNLEEINLEYYKRRSEVRGKAG